jgi:hypothetical protein
MPRFFFDLDNDEYSADETGTELRDVIAARVEAIKFMGVHLYEHPKLLWDGAEIRVIVRDEQSSILFTAIALSVDCCRPVNS